MRLKGTIIVTLLIIGLFTNVTATASNDECWIEETDSVQGLENYQTTQTADKDGTSHPLELQDSSQSSNPKTQNSRPETWGSNIFGLNPFGRDMSSHTMDKWSTFAYVDEDSLELVIGVDDAQPDAYTGLIDLIVENGGKLANTVSIGDEVIALVVDTPFNAVSSFVAQMQASNLARYVEPNMKVQAQFVPNDPYWSMQWGPQKIEADLAWNTTVGDSSVLVAVVDTGIYYTHPDLAANYVALGYDWVNMDTNPMDDHGHGTHCAGIIAAVLNNSIGIAGLAQVRVMAEKVLDSGGWGYWDWVASGIIHATDYGADIISMSLGGYGYSELLHEAIKYAYDSGVLVIAAAGNGNTNMKPYPAGYDEVIAVAATDQYDYKALFSNWGDWIELAAPGVNIYSTVPGGYESWSGTSMAAPHVSGVAALVWSRHPNKTRDWVRLWLRYTADDLGDPSFDVYYGYGRINARKAVEQTPLAHELIAYEWRTPPYVEPGALGIINATVLNFGESNETDVTVRLLANGTMVDSALIGFLASGDSTTISLAWNPTVEGLYNVTLYLVPVPSETNLENNVLWKYIYVGFPVKAVVLHSAGNIYSDIITNWQVLNNEWHMFGDTMVYIDYTTWNIADITYDDLVASDADVLIISCAFMWEFTDSEIEAISRYVLEGHGLIATAGTLYYGVPNNNKLAPLFGLKETTTWSSTWTDLLHIENTTHPLFVNIPDPFVFRQVGTAIPWDYSWDSNELFEGTYVARGHFKESAIVVNRGLVYISPWLEIIPPYYHFHLQLLYNAITWSKYQKPEHELVVSLNCPSYLEPGESTLLNATVYNRGLNNETGVELYLMIDDSVVNSTTIPELLTGSFYKIDYLWAPTVEGTYNVTAYAPPVPSENFTTNNRATKLVTVTYPLIRPIEGQWANYTLYSFEHERLIGVGKWNFTYDHYISPYLINITLWSEPPLYGYITTGWMIVNIMNRRVESGVWAGMWYPGWIETSIALGSKVNLLDGTATVVGSRIIQVGAYPIDCWELLLESYGIKYTFCYDKASGLWVSMEYTMAPYSEEIMLVATNIPIGVRYDHEIAVTLEAPAFLEPGESSLLNATVYNIGLSNETDVELQLLINDTVVNSTIIPKLVNGTYYTIDYFWTPPVEATYNITAYAPPVSGENITANNIHSQYVIVSYAPKILAYVQFTDYYQEYANALKAIDSTFGPNYLLTDLWDYTQLDSMLSGNDILFVPEQEYTDLPTMEMIGASWSTTLSNFVAEGGIIIVCDYSGGSHGILTGAGLMSISGVNYITGRTVYLVDPSDPLAEGVSSTFIAPNGALNFITAETNVVFNDGINPVVIHKTIGSGHIALIGFDYYESNPDADRILGNSVGFWILYEHEIAVSLEAPTFLEPGDSSLLNATVYNRGLSNETNVELLLLVNGTIVNNVIIPELPSGMSYTIDYLWTPTLEATYNVTAYAPPISDEKVTTNNFMSRMVAVSLAPPMPVIYVEPSIITAEVGETFTINVNVKNITDLFGYDFLLNYTTAVLTATEITLGDFFPPDAMIWYKKINDTAGYVRYAVTMPPGSQFGKSGSGTLATIIFTVDSIGESPLYLIADKPPHHILLNHKGQYIIHSEYDGYFSSVAVHDVAVIDVKPYPTEVLVGESLTINVTVWNQGDFTETFNVTAYYASVPIDTQTVVSLGVGATTTLKFTWNTTDIAEGNYTIRAEASAVVGEGDTADNTYVDGIVTITLPLKAPLASFTYTPADPAVGETVTFDASASYDPDGTIVSYSWDFGDGASGSGITTTHVYAAGGTYTVALTAIDNEGLNSTVTMGLTVLRTTIDVQVEVGSIHFRGEIAEFYVLVSSLGKPIDASINATLYYNGKLYEDLSASAEHVSLGFYRITYTIPLTASTGTYALVVEASYQTLSGISLESFLLSPTLTGWNALLVSINGTVGTLKTDLGLIKVKLDAIDAKLIKIEGTTVTINSTVGLIQTDIATIEASIGTIEAILEEWTGVTTISITTPLGTFRILVLTTSSLEGSIAFSDNVLVITLSGPLGTRGTTNIVIPKQLLIGIESTIDKVAVTIDDQPVVFTYTEQPEAYVLSMSYTHSTHTIKIYLQGIPPPPAPFPWTLYIIATAIIIFAVSASLAIYLLKIRKPRIAKTQ